MALEAFLDSNRQLAMPLINGAGGILEVLSSHSSLKNDDHLDSILNTNFASDVMNSAIVRKSSISRYDVGHAAANLSRPTSAYLHNHGSTDTESYINLSSASVSVSSCNPVNIFSSDATFHHLCQGQQEKEKQQLGSTIGSADFYKTKSQTCQNALPVRTKQEPGTLTPILKKPRLDVNQENIQKQEIIQEFLLSELQGCNPQLNATIKQHRQQIQLHQPTLCSAPELKEFHLQLQKQQIRSLLQEQGNHQGTFAPLLDVGICSWQLKQYLYHLRNNSHDNGIAYWKKFVSKYYAPGSKKKWCFSTYENIELHATGVFHPKSMETWCCDICGSRSGKGLEATFDIFPRLFKLQFESGMIEEILFLDSPRAFKIPSGLVLEYRKAIQESVYETFRVIHEGQLRVVFRHDLKMSSWEFCTQKHEEFLIRRLVSPQVNQLAQAANKYQNGTQNGVSFRVSSLDLQTLCNMFVSAGNQLARNMELPLVNDLGYPKRFIRCLQIAEAVDSMKDLVAFSLDTKMGPIQCLNNYSQSSKTRNQMEEELFTGAQNLSIFPQQPGPRYHANAHRMTENGAASGPGSLPFTNLDHQLLGQNSSILSVLRKGQESCLMDHSNQAIVFMAQSLNSRPCSYPQSSKHSKNPDQALVNKLRHEMVGASKGKSMQNTHGKLNNELHYSDSSSASPQVNSANASRAWNFSKTASHGNLSATSKNITVKTKPYSPERLPEAIQDSAAWVSRI